MAELITRMEPLGDGVGSVELVQHVGNDKMVVNAARVSFGGDNTAPLNKRDIKLIKYLLEHEHGSPLEHNLITFKMVWPIFIDRQAVRHRVGVSKNEISGRYVELKDRVYTPVTFRMQAPVNRQASVEPDLDRVPAFGFESIEGWNDAVTQVYRENWEHAYSTYQSLLALGVTREQARGVLPLALFTESYYTFNIRSLLHFTHLRNHAGAQWEIQEYAKAMLEMVRPLFPVTIAAWEELNAEKVDE